MVSMPTWSFEVSFLTCHLNLVLYMAWCLCSLHRAHRVSEGVVESAGHSKCWLREKESITVWRIDCWAGAEDCLQGGFPKSSLFFCTLASCWLLRGWTGGMGDCKPSSFVLESWEEASLTLSLLHRTLGLEPSVLSLRVAFSFSSGNE